MQGRIRKIGWWRRHFDKDVKRALERARTTTEYQTVDYTDSGVAITMPKEIADEWDMLPADVRAEFMAHLEQQIAAGGDASGTHEWNG